MKPSPWSLERSEEAALKNAMLLQQHDFDIESATQTPQNTILSYGAEFRPLHGLNLLFHRHHQWEKIQQIITNGVTYPLKPISEADRLKDIDTLIKRGNHKSAKITENRKALDKSFDKEVKYSWALPLPIHCIQHIKGACVTPLGVAVQWSINAANDRIQKRRTTHDCTFPGPSGNSCNKRVIKELLDDCHYGHAFRRFLHGIHDMRIRHPEKIIFMNKTDMDAAYRRIHTNMQAAVTCITIIDELAYLLVRLPFGSGPAPSIFSTVSDTAADTAQDLAMDTSWDPNELHSHFQLDFAPCVEPTEIPFAPADTLAMTLPPRDICTDNFIDDLFQACVHTGDNAERIKHAVPLILDTMFKPPDTKDACHRDAIINMTKHVAEGRLEERKVILGWLVDTRRFRVYLTPHKATEWLIDLDAMTSTETCTVDQLESTIGRLNHTSILIHIGRYFLTRLRYRLRTTKQHKFSKIKLAKWDLADLILWHDIITHLTEVGVSINNVCITKPSSTTYSDACTWGIGGNTMRGTAWQFIIPIALRGRATINFLEFLAAIITIELAITEDTHDSAFPHILAFTDSSSALGWLYHSTFNPKTHLPHDKLARHLARLLFKHEATIYPEHIPGVENEVADSLSRDIHLSHEQLTTLITSHAKTSQVPHSFHIIKLPRKTISWIESTLLSIPQREASPAKPSPSKLALSVDSKNSSTNVPSQTHSSTTTPTHKNNSSSPLLPTATATTTTEQTAGKSFKATLSMPPSPMWFRPSGKTFGLIPPAMNLEKRVPSSPDKSKLTKIPTPQRRAKRAYHQ